MTSFEGSIRFVEYVREHGSEDRGGVVVASNAGPVLAAADLTDLFDDRVDGLVAEELGLPGKPAPDTFLEAARRLGTTPARAVVVEDAVVGVEAGRLGGFGFVIGVDREGDSDRLLEHGADVVVDDLGELVPA